MGKREEQAEELAAAMPVEHNELLRLAAAAVDELEVAVLAGEVEAADLAKARYDAVIWKMNGGNFLGCAAGKDSPVKVLKTFCQAIPGQIPKWGQPGAFIVILDGMRVLVEFGGIDGLGPPWFVFKAVDLDTWFISYSGFRSRFEGLRYGLTVEQTAKEILAEYLKNNRHEIRDRDRDRLAQTPLPSFLDKLEPPARRSPATLDVPPGYVLIDVVLPSQKAFIARKWAKEASQDRGRKTSQGAVGC